MALEAMDVRLRVLKESNKCRFHSYSVRNRVLIISHIAFRDCQVLILSDNLSRNSCIRTSAGIVLALTLRAWFAGKDALSIPLRFLFFFLLLWGLSTNQLWRCLLTMLKQLVGKQERT